MLAHRLPDTPFRVGGSAYYTGTDVSIRGGRAGRQPAFRKVMVALHSGSVYDGLANFSQQLGIQGEVAWSPTPSLGFIRALVRRVRPSFVVEVGTFLGATTIHLARELDSLHGSRSSRPLVLSVDTWLGDAYMWSSKAERYKGMLRARHGKPLLYYQFLANVAFANLTHRVVPLSLGSSEAARLLDYFGWAPDLVYIDASHDALDVLADLEHYHMLLRCGGTLFGDDVHWGGVKSALTHFARRHGLGITAYNLPTRYPESEGKVVNVSAARGPNTKWVLEPKRCTAVREAPVR